MTVHRKADQTVLHSGILKECWKAALLDFLSVACSAEMLAAAMVGLMAAKLVETTADLLVQHSAFQMVA